MFRHTSTYVVLFLTLLLGSWLSLVVCDDNNDASIAETVEVDETSIEQPGEDNSTLQECKFPSNSTIQKCCRSLDIDQHFIKCFLLHQKRMPKSNDQNPTLLIKFFSCLIECVYKTKKYIGKGDSLNMNVIKSDAGKKFNKDDKLKNHMIEMYQYCERHASSEWGKMKSHAAARVIFTGACKPYFLFVFLCTSKYNAEVKCPYFTWQGEKSKNTVEECEQLKQDCEKLQS